MKHIAYLCILFLFICCGTGEVISNLNKECAIRPVIIYKTTKDFSNLVPVLMDENKAKIVSYPAISDISESSKPIKLENGYWLDNIGICNNTVYTSYTVTEYSSLKYQPSVGQLQNKIIERNPFVEIYRCNMKDLSIDALNKEIRNHFKNSIRTN